MQRVLHARRVADLVGAFDRSPAYRGLAEALLVLISDGRIAAGVRLPSERELTDALDVSRTTVTRAYAELRDLGFLTSRQGSGWVASLPSSHGLRGDHLLPPGEQPEGKIDLTCAAGSAPAGILAAYERAMTRLPSYVAGSGYFPSGLPVLREVVAAAYDARGVPTSPDQVMIVPGALAGIGIAARALLRPGDRVMVESPTYPNAIAALAGTGARVVGVDADPAGCDWGADVRRSLRQTRPALTYLVPDFHNPTGALRSDADRETAAAGVAASGAAAIIDESLVELTLDGATATAFAAHLDGVVSVGSTSKAFWGGLRVGWLRVPAAMMPALLASRLSSDLGVPVLEQLVAADLLTDGTSIIDERRARLREARDRMLVALATHLPSWRATTPPGGLSLWCALPEALSSALVPHALARDVLLAPGPAFAPEGGLDGFLRLPFAQPAEVLEEAVARLAQAWEQTLIDPHGAPGRTAMVA